MNKKKKCELRQKLLSIYPQIVDDIECLFGAKFKDWKLNDVRIHNGGGPQNTAHDPNDPNGCIINIAADISDETQLLFQFYHEAVHTLYCEDFDPQYTKVIDEGLATYFQVEKVERKLMPPPGSRYQCALLLIEELVQINSEAIRDIRDLEKNIRNIQPSHILQICPSYPSEKAEALCTPFHQ